MKTIAKYKITYIFNTPLNYIVIQYKDLIEYEDYINDIKPTLNKIYELEVEINNLGKKNKKIPLLEQEIYQLKSYIKKNYGSNYFTNNSLLYKSQFNNGFMYDKVFKVKLEVIEGHTILK